MNSIVNFPYNALGVARVDEHGIIHNHLYHDCKCGRIDDNNVLHNDVEKYSPVGRFNDKGEVFRGDTLCGYVEENGFVYNDKKIKVGRVNKDYLRSGAALLLIINELR